MAQVCDVCENKVRRVYTIESGQEVCSACYRDLVGEAVPPPLEGDRGKGAAPWRTSKPLHANDFSSVGGGYIGLGMAMQFIGVLLIIAGLSADVGPSYYKRFKTDNAIGSTANSLVALTDQVAANTSLLGGALLFAGGFCAHACGHLRRIETAVRGAKSSTGDGGSDA